MNKLAKAICKYRKMILIVGMLLLIPAAIGMKMTRINYDILVYLPEDIETIQGEKILSEDFDMGGYSIVIIENMKEKDILQLEDEIKKMENVEKVVSIADVIGTEIPKEMLPTKVQDMIYNDNKTIMMVTFKEQLSSDETMKSVDTLKKITDDKCKISGMTATILDTRELSDSEVVIYVVIAVILCLIVLQLALDSYFAPILLLANIGIAVLYNMGTNIFLGEISYITKAISAVLQLGVTMDFAIFLYHSYIAEQKNVKDKNEAMANAITKTFSSVLGSSLTTIAGFLALCSMNLTLGKDIGLVMAKGVLFGVVSVVTILPAMILTFDKLIEKTRHREILPKFAKLRDFTIKHYIVIAISFVIILPIAYFGYKNTQVYYDLDRSLPKDLPSVEANTSLKEDFNMVSMEMLLIDKDIPEYKANELIEKIENLDGIEWVLGYSKLGSSRNSKRCNS